MIPAILIFAVISVPPAIKVIAVSVSVYAALQGLKNVPVFTQYLTGWWAILFNFVLSAVGLIVTLTPQELYTQTTLNLVIGLLMTSLAAAGIHGTVKSQQPPTVLATTPPDGKVKEVPATLVPNDPADKPIPKQ
jgi:hypothetical protein